MERFRYFGRLYQKAFGAYSWQIALIITLALISSIVEGLGISAIIPVFSFVGGSGGAANDTISRIIQGLFALLHLTYTFRILLIFIAALFVFRIVLIFGIQYVTGSIVYDYERDLRTRLFEATLRARWPYLSRQKIGNLEQLLTTNTSNASQFFGSISTSAMVVTKVLIYMVLAVNISSWVALLALAGGGAMFFVLKPVFYRTRDVAKQAERTNRELAHFVGEHMIGMKAIKAMALEQPVLSRGKEYFEAMRRLSTRSIILRGYVQALVQIASVVFVGLIFAVMYRSPGFSLASFAVIVYAISQIFSQIQSAQVQIHGITTLFPYIAETIRYGDHTRDNEELQGGAGAFSLNESIALRSVSFSYPERGTVLKDVTFTVRRGELVGIAGPSGSGKTTLADLLLRLAEPSKGTIYADGRDIREIPLDAWRTHVGYVPQDAVLLDDTIEENIRFYNPRLGRGDVVRAAKLANIHDFIESLPQKYNTVIGDRGVLVSGGQKQRIALARILARKPQLLVLDEATSSLDMESERAIQETIEALRGTTTILVIAHRLSTIEHADRFVTVQGGTVKEVNRSEVVGESV